MSTTLNSDVCRITVVGPDKRVDLAVPASTTVAALMPVLVWHTGAAQSSEELRADGAWVLQRLGEAPFDPVGTPESLDWLEGEELYLRLAEDPLPELAFDDLADGIATMVNRRNDRWQPEYRRTLFLGLSAVGMALLALVLVDRGPVLLSAIAGFTLAAVFMLSSVLYGRSGDRPLSLLFGVGAAAYAGVTSLNLVDGVPDALAPNPASLMIGASAAAAVALCLVVAQRLWAENLPYPPMLALLITAIATIFVLWLRSYFGMSGPGAARDRRRPALRGRHLRAQDRPTGGPNCAARSCPRPATSCSTTTSPSRPRTWPGGPTRPTTTSTSRPSWWRSACRSSSRSSWRTAGWAGWTLGCRLLQRTAAAGPLVPSASGSGCRWPWPGRSGMAW